MGYSLILNPDGTVSLDGTLNVSGTLWDNADVSGWQDITAVSAGVSNHTGHQDSITALNSK